MGRLVPAANPWTLLRAVASAWATALVLKRLAARLPFDELLRRLRIGKPFPGELATPTLHLRVVNRLLRVLPPSEMGPCMKRSLLLLHLWSRCGLAPRLHLGVARAGEEGFRAHAWLTADVGGAHLAAGSGDGYAEAFVFPQAGERPAGDEGASGRSLPSGTR